MIGPSSRSRAWKFFSIVPCTVPKGQSKISSGRRIQTWVRVARPPQNQMVVQGEAGSGPAAAMPVTDTPGGARTASEVNTGTEASQAAEQVQDSVPIDGFDDSVPIDAFSMPDSVDGLVAATQSGVNE